jgi:hypothetical protein
MFENGRRPQFFGNGRQPQFVKKWKTTSIFRKWKTTSICLKIEDNLNILNGKRPTCFWEMEDDLNFF